MQLVKACIEIFSLWKNRAFFKCFLTAFLGLGKIATALLQTCFSDRKRKQKFCDGKLKAGRTEFPVHKCVVGLVSEYFENLFLTEVKQLNKVCRTSLLMFPEHVPGFPRNAPNICHDLFS